MTAANGLDGRFLRQGSARPPEGSVLVHAVESAPTDVDSFEVNSDQHRPNR